MDPATAQLWGPGGKCFQPEKKLSDYVGRNEKCKVGGRGRSVIICLFRLPPQVASVCRDAARDDL